MPKSHPYQLMRGLGLWVIGATVIFNYSMDKPTMGMICCGLAIVFLFNKPNLK